MIIQHKIERGLYVRTDISKRTASVYQHVRYRPSESLLTDKKKSLRHCVTNFLTFHNDKEN